MIEEDKIFIIRIGEKFVGYRAFALNPSRTMDDIISEGHFEFEADNVKDAMTKASSLNAKHDYEFYIPRKTEKIEEIDLAELKRIQRELRHAWHLYLRDDNAALGIVITNMNQLFRYLIQIRRSGEYTTEVKKDG